MPLPNEKKASQFIAERVKDYNTKFRKYLRPGQISTFDAVLIANEFEVYLVKSLELQRQKFVEENKHSIGLMRQWLNEDRITDDNRMVTSEELEHWFNLKSPSN